MTHNMPSSYSLPLSVMTRLLNTNGPPPFLPTIPSVLIVLPVVRRHLLFCWTRWKSSMDSKNRRWSRGEVPWWEMATDARQWVDETHKTRRTSSGWSWQCRVWGVNCVTVPCRCGWLSSVSSWILTARESMSSTHTTRLSCWRSSLCCPHVCDLHITKCVGQVRGRLTEVVVDQLPCLADLQRYLEHLAFMEPPAVKKEVILEQVRLSGCWYSALWMQ